MRLGISTNVENCNIKLHVQIDTNAGCRSTTTSVGLALAQSPNHCVVSYIVCLNIIIQVL